MKLQKEWSERLQKINSAKELALESESLRRANADMRSAGNKQYVTDAVTRMRGNLAFAEAMKLKAESDIVKAQAEIDWLESVASEYGDCNLSWLSDGACVVQWVVDEEIKVDTYLAK